MLIERGFSENRLETLDIVRSAKRVESAFPYVIGADPFSFEYNFINRGAHVVLAIVNIMF